MARLQVGGYRYLQNFRKGLHQQRARGLEEFAKATQDGNAETASDCRERLLWIQQKFAFLDTGNEMIWDGLVTKRGRRLPYDSLGPECRRLLTDAEIRWNKEIIDKETFPAPPAATALAGDAEPEPPPGDACGSSSCNSSSWRR